MEDYIRPHIYIALRLPSGFHKVTQLKPNTTVSLGKFGTFASNDLIGRPFYLTYEIVDNASGEKRTKLRVVSPSELYAQDEIPEADLSEEQPARDETTGDSKGQFEIVDQTGKVLLRTNQNILDDNAAQKLTAADIEQLKQAESASGRDIIAKIMESHSELDKKTAFSLAKYTTRKAQKYLRRFVPVPVDVPFLARWWLYEKEPSKIMDIREESLSLIASWSNVHYVDPNVIPASSDLSQDVSRGRWLVVDETGGLIVAAIAEKLGILHSAEPESNSTQSDVQDGPTQIPSQGEESMEGVESTTQTQPKPPRPISKAVLAQESHMSATDNTITLIHANAQPNLALLSYHNYDYTNSDPDHPLHQHLKIVSWLQLLHPEEDPNYEEPETIEKEALEKLKSTKRGAYYRKRRRWERIKGVIDQTRAGGFDGLIVASVMSPESVIHHLAPLLRGGANVVVYSPNVEPLAELVDCYSAQRKSAFLNADVDVEELPTGDFPVNPTLLLNPTVYTARVRPWQVLPGRTHPLMTGIGGPEGYVFTASRVIPIEGERVEARGSFKRRKIAKTDTAAKADVTPKIEAKVEEENASIQRVNN